ncbi:MAG: 1,4-alpha-glucan branching protein GlgB [Isosphaeraceae bacterium]
MTTLRAGRGGSGGGSGPGDGPIDDDARVELERQALPEFLRRQRWYAGKARKLESTRIVEAIRPQDFPNGTVILLVEVRHGDGATDTYFLPARLIGGAEAERLVRESSGRIIARQGGAKGQRVLYDGMADPAVCQAMLEAIAAERVFRGESGEVCAVRTGQFVEARGSSQTPLEVVLGKAEQSNSAVMFGDRLILKTFRRVEPGINPDFEIGRFLGDRTDFNRVPKVAGGLEYHRKGAEPTSLAILQGLVPNQGNGWEHALEELKDFYERVQGRELAGELALDPGVSYLDLADREPPPAVRELIGPYAKAAAQLGRRTAELHRALASDPKDPAFTPEPITRADLEELRAQVDVECDRTLGVLKEHLEQLDSDTKKTAHRVLDGRDRLRERVRGLPEITARVTKTRVHGDYHLGQVLRDDDDYVILDFEGEPARSLEERRAKRSPLKDVVGMLRSFDYAAYAALFERTKDRPGDFARLEPWARFWRTWASAIFWREYRAVTGEASYLPADPDSLRLLLDANLLEKALYELLYELNNRQDWVRIPLQGIAALTREESQSTSATPASTDGPRLSEFDLYLLDEGTHYRSYRKLGAHVVGRRGTRGVDFAVWAPNASAVSVVGDFNDWDPSASPMTRSSHGGVWETFVAGVESGALYRYSIQPRGSSRRIEKADPHGFFAVLRPGTASRVWDLTRYPWGDRDWMAERAKHQAPDAPLSIYEVHLGSWMRVPEEGNRWLSYRELAPRLADYVQEMGFTHVEFLPVGEHPFDGSWGYEQVGPYAPTSRFGTPDDFRFLVDTLHQRGIGVLLDWVPAHFPNDRHGLSLFDGTHLYENADPRRSLHRDWNTFAYDYERPQVANFLISNALYWLEVHHIDGLRVDAVASMLYLDYSRKPGEWLPNELGGRENLGAIAFLRRLNDRVHAEFPDALMIAEESTSWPMVSRPTNVGGLGFDMKWDMGWMHDTLSYFGHDPIHRRYHHDLLTFRGMYAFNENFVLPLSHDEVVHLKGSLVNKMPGDEWQKFANLRLLFGWMYAQPGKKLLFMGDEFGQWREWNHDASLDWHLLGDPMRRGLRRWVRDLNTTHRGEPALHQQDFRPEGFGWADLSDSEQSVIGVFRRGISSDDIILLAFNFTPVPRHNYRFGVPRGGFWREILNSDAPLYGGSGQGNIGGAETAPVGWHGQLQSVNLVLPPLGMVALKWAGARRVEG